MSAICGILNIGDLPPQQDALERMMQAMARHGPDGSGHWHDESICLGHQMMHITPESLTEQLPRHDSESRLAITADARLDNREDLAGALGISLADGISDSGLLLKAFLKWGRDCGQHLVGEFAFAIWDARDHCLHCFRDPMGVRPLFYREIPGRYFAFASEVAPLLALGDKRPPINERLLAMLGVSAMTTCLEPESTCFETVLRIPAATVLSVRPDGKQLSEYWRPNPGKRLHFNSDAECKEAFQEVFFKAVNARLRSAFPVASLLSGGLDSSGIVGAASSILARENRSLITLSTVPMPSAQGQVVDEREYIDVFKDRPNLEMRYVAAPGAGAYDDLRRLVQTASLCSYTFQHFVYTALVRAARDEGARILLDGRGGEQSATCAPEGYLAELFLAARWRTLARELRCIDADNRITSTTVKRQVLRPLLPYSLLRALNRHSKHAQMVEYPLRAEFIQDVLGQDAERVRQQVYRLLAVSPDHRRNMARNIQLERGDVRERLHAGFIDYQDVQFSYPYLDRRVLEFSLAVDGGFKYRDGRGRQLLRVGMADSLPPAILKRYSKAPFSPDYYLRYERDRDTARTALQRFSEQQNLHPIVDFEKVGRALERRAVYNTQSPMRMDYGSQFLVPFAMYMCYFLDSFAAGDGQTRMP
jgi:asparagine synthase (glutamine-hydrolysing)